MHVCALCMCFHLFVLFLMSETEFIIGATEDTDEKVEKPCYFNLRLSVVASFWKNVGTTYLTGIIAVKDYILLKSYKILM